MSPIPLGILAAQFDAPIVGGGTFDLLETQVLASAAASVTFSSLNTLAAGYQHLQIRAVARKSNTDNSQYIRFNGDTGNNYASHYMWGNGSSVLSSSNTSNDHIKNFPFAGSDYTANAFGAYVMDILDPFESTKNTTIRQFSALSNVQIQLASGFWNNTASLTSITLTVASGELIANSRFSLYGVKTGA